MIKYSTSSPRRVAKQIMDFREDKIKEILSGFSPDFKNEVVINIIRNKIERGRNEK